MTVIAPMLPPFPPVLGRTRALRTNWCWYQPDDLLIDAGDGCSVDLGSHRALAKPKRVFLTHGHGDHLWGLIPLLLNRSMPSLESGEPLQVYWPAGTPQIEEAIALTRRLFPAIDAHGVTFTPITADFVLPLKGRRRLVAFPTQHIREGVTLGYAVVEQRTHLRPAFHGQPDAIIREARASLGDAAVVETRDHPLFVHTGDTMPVEAPWFRDAEWVIYDCTFLDAGDRDAPTHATLAEVLAVADAQPPKRLVLHHLSLRYDRATLVQDLAARVAAHAPAYPVLLWDDMNWTLLWDGERLSLGGAR